MKTIIELYDDESILNLLSVCSFKPAPENVVFIGEFPDKKKTAELKGWVDGFLASRDINANTYFRHVDTSDCTNILDVLFEAEEEFPECVLEVCGGKYLVLLAAGIFVEHCDIPIFHYNIEKKRFEDIRDMPEADKIAEPVFTAGEMLTLSHAGTIGHGHFSSANLDLSVRTDIRELWAIFLAYRTVWHKTMLFFQAAKGDDNAPLNVDCQRDIVPGVRVEEALFRDLERAGIITGLYLTPTRVRFKYKNPTVKAILRDAGAVLEVFTYTCIKKRPDLFNDCEINLCIDWDGDGPSRTNNELDVIAVSGVTPLFISCKSGKIEPAYLNEIYALTYRLGGVFAKPVLMTGALYPGMEDSTVLQRGRDLGIEEITLPELCEKISSKNRMNINTCRMCSHRDCENRLAERLYKLCR